MILIEKIAAGEAKILRMLRKAKSRAGKADAAKWVEGSKARDRATRVRLEAKAMRR